MRRLGAALRLSGAALCPYSVPQSTGKGDLHILYAAGKGNTSRILKPQHSCMYGDATTFVDK